MVKTYICDQVDSRDLLHHLSAHTQKCSVEEALPSILEDELERSLARGCLLVSNGLRDLLDFNTDDSVIFLDLFGIVLQTPDDVASLVFISMFDELHL